MFAFRHVIIIPIRLNLFLFPGCINLLRDGPEPIRRHAGHYRRHQSVPGAVQRFPQNHRHPIDQQQQQLYLPLHNKSASLQKEKIQIQKRTRSAAPVFSFLVTWVQFHYPSSGKNVFLFFSFFSFFFNLVDSNRRRPPLHTLDPILLVFIFFQSFPLFFRAAFFFFLNFQVNKNKNQRTTFSLLFRCVDFVGFPFLNKHIITSMDGH